MFHQHIKNNRPVKHLSTLVDVAGVEPAYPILTFKTELQPFCRLFILYRQCPVRFATHNAGLAFTTQLFRSCHRYPISFTRPGTLPRLLTCYISNRSKVVRSAKRLVLSVNVIHCIYLLTTCLKCLVRPNTGCVH